MKGADGAKTMITIMDWLILGAEHQARYFSWRAPLAARIVVGSMFMSSGWTKLHNFPVMIENFAGWGISFPSVMKPFVLGLEFVGGLCLLLGLLTQIFAPMLVVVMLLRRSEPSGVSSILWKRC
jgi:putative oxidoreductase